MFQAVIRHLPPSMTASEFISAVEPLPDHNYFWFEEADNSLGQHAFSRAYINFKEREDIDIFTEKFDGYVFVDTKGNEYPASVEFAPFQKIPRIKVVASGEKFKPKSRDMKGGTIETDPEYLSFLESIKESKTESNLPSAEIYLEEMEKRAKELKENHGCPKMMTPLIEYVMQKRMKPTQEVRNQRRDRREERVKAKGPSSIKQEQAKAGHDGKSNRKDRRRERRERRGDRNSNADKPKESIKMENVKVLKKEEKNLVLKPKNVPKLVQKQTEEAINKVESNTVSKVSNNDPNSTTLQPPAVAKSGNNEPRHGTELKKPITGKTFPSPSHSRGAVGGSGNRDQRKGDRSGRRGGDGRKGDEVRKVEKKQEPIKDGRKELEPRKESTEKETEKKSNTGSITVSSAERKRENERRVRNKDRPDIPRYQPKIRTSESSRDHDQERTSDSRTERNRRRLT